MPEVKERTSSSSPFRRRSAYSAQTWPRKEDDRLLRGDGRFTDDVDRAHVVEMAVGRCPYPHARVVRIDTTAALALGGVRQVLVGAELPERCGPIGILRPMPGRTADPAFRAREGGRHLRGPAGRQRRRYEPAHRRGRHRADRHRVRAAAARLRRRLGSRAGRSGHPSRGARLEPARLQPAGLRRPRGDDERGRRRGRGPLLRQPGDRAADGDRGPFSRSGARVPASSTVHVSTQVPHLVRKQLAETLRLDEGTCGCSRPTWAADSASRSASTPRTCSPACTRCHCGGPSSGWRTATSTSVPQATGASRSTTTRSALAPTGASSP